jgi:hypothetical protein
MGGFLLSFNLNLGLAKLDRIEELAEIIRTNSLSPQELVDNLELIIHLTREAGIYIAKEL